MLASKSYAGVEWALSNLPRFFSPGEGTAASSSVREGRPGRSRTTPKHVRGRGDNSSPVL